MKWRQLGPLNRGEPLHTVVVCLYFPSASSGLYKVLTAPVKGLGAYVYLLLIKILNGILPAENGQLH